MVHLPKGSKGNESVRGHDTGRDTRIKAQEKVPSYTMRDTVKIIEDVGLCVGELFDKIRKLESENAFLRGQLHAHKPSKHLMIYKNKMWMCSACDWWCQDDGSYDAGDRCQVSFDDHVELDRRHAQVFV